MSRRKGRYERRKTRREDNRLRRVAAVGGLHDVFGYDDMYKAGKKYRSAAVDWGNGWIAVVGTWRGMRILFEPV
jgi:hypothetical protein